MSVTSGYTSREFFHFCGRETLGDNEKTYEILLKILDNGCISHKPHNNDWGKTSYTTNPTETLLSEKLIDPTVTCYCDIPRSQLTIHATKYGPFAVSFARDFVIKYGARPVLYIPIRVDDWKSPFGQSLLKNIEAKYKGFVEHVVSKLDPNAHKSTTVGGTPNGADEASKLLSNIMERDILAFIKPFNSHLPDDHKDNFYLEREWRKYGNLKFVAEDVQRVLLPAAYLDRFRKDRPTYANKAEVI